ncbi:hypothetical protein FC84_GL000943 [Lapidilactobacillus dextrinicus DSM 20335]|uniref:Glycosyltransferase RgtA/B/C/D-like domain-containing protein n=1 Tax=Lapidilactobacillus dextrinicus DSM 20335 TaxID=1423738 RepID=A0A0R2BK02_9LACO|nr:glycosyltransferase family 39 protein [Lapidilactobacillus dextrinicus]KRM79639.1 hypothetical protein FC84_GL000943 [Lapidilactobacillus dextrinicus DSM 20335]
MKKISHFLFQQINNFYIVLIIVTMFGALRATNFNINLISSKLILALICFCLIFSFDRSRALLTKLIRLFLRNIKIITFIIILVIPILQFYILSKISTPIGWDVGGIINNLFNRGAISRYLSLNPNNQFLFFLLYGYAKAVKLVDIQASSWIYFQLLNIFFIDLSIFFLYKAADNLFNKRIAYISVYLYIFWFVLSPWIQVPYSDTLMVLLTSIVFFFYSKIVLNKSFSLPNLLFLGIFIGISYLIKPSSIIYVVSFFIIYFLKLIINKNYEIKNKIRNIAITFFSVLIMIFSFNLFVQKQNVINYDQNQSKPVSLFISMGMRGTGGYNSKETQMNEVLKTPKDRNKYNLHQIKEQLKEYRISGYVKFLIIKHFNNTDRGDFGWGRDGTPQKYPDNNSERVTNLLRSLYYQQGALSNNIRFYMQIIWVVILFGMLCVPKNNNSTKILILKLTIIGIFLYLLIFEGGRSRYLIQYLPIIILLSSTGWNTIFNKYKLITKKY